MSHTSGHDPREIEAQALLDQAENGAIPELGEYTIRQRDREHTIAIPDIVIDNCAGELADSATLYGDLVSGRVIIDLDTTE